MNGASVITNNNNGLSPRGYSAWKLLKYTYGIAAIVAGIDKFFNLITVWSHTAHPSLLKLIALEPAQFMYIVGALEIIIGILVLSMLTKFGAYLIAVWFLINAGDLLTMGVHYDTALHYVVMALAAVALALLSRDFGCYKDSCAWLRK